MRPDSKISDLAARRPIRVGLVVPLCLVGLSLGLVGVLSTNAFHVVLANGAVALCIVAAAAGLGVSLVRWLGPKAAPLRWRLFLAFGLGLGGLSLAVLGLGCAGHLGRTMWCSLLALFALTGIVQLKGFLRAGPSPESASPLPKLTWCMLGLAPFAAAALLVATMPPGILWPGEGGGYDALEYHLGAPRDYFDAGRIAYLPNNIYSNFPFNVEMLYLLSMVLHGDPVRAALTAQLIHTVLAIMAVGAIGLAAREVSRSAGIVAMLTAGTTPFLFYLSGLAYVEHGLFLFSSIAAAAAIRAMVATESNRRWAFLAGLFAGLACGCKYTGIAATLLPILVVLVVDGIRRKTNRLGSPVVFVMGAVVAVSPWLIKNWIATGNPVFPLGYSVFGAWDGVWNDGLADKWHRGHLPAVADRSPEGRAARLVSQILWSPFFGPCILMGCAAGLYLTIRRRVTPDSNDHPASTDATRPALWICAAMILVGTAIWFGFTHLVDRFAIVLVAPCSILTGIAWCRLPSAAYRRIALTLPILAAIFNGRTIVRLLTTGGTVAVDATGPESGVNYLQADIFGATELMTQPSPLAPQHLIRINALLREGRRVLLVGDARRFYYERGVDYCVVFNRNPFAEAAESKTPFELIDWLRSQRYDFVYVDWLEMRRLRSTYGFWDAITVELFRDLHDAGLGVVEDFRIDDAGGPYGTLFEVPN